MAVTLPPANLNCSLPCKIFESYLDSAVVVVGQPLALLLNIRPLPLKQMDDHIPSRHAVVAYIVLDIDGHQSQAQGHKNPKHLSVSLSFGRSLCVCCMSR